MRYAFRLAVVATAALALTACSDDDDDDGDGGDAETFQAQMTGAAERPTPVTTAGTGNATVTVNGTSLSVTGNFQGLTGPASAAHIHGPADKETAASVLCPLSASAAASGTVTGTCTFSAEQLQQLRDGRMYVNVHTSQFPQGEIRGQLE
jgi:hypothetical protein